jgi:curved DNA-binding protein CbpA
MPITHEGSAPERVFFKVWFMTGNLSEQLISEPLQTIHQNSHSGTLRIRRQSIVKELTFDQGLCVDVQSNDSADDFGELLLRIGKLSPDQLHAASKSASPSALPFTLLEMNLVEPSELMNFQTLHAQEAVYSLFNWTTGNFEFVAGSIAARRMTSLKITLPNLIFEGIRRVTNPEVIHRGLKGSDRLVRLAPQFERKAGEISLRPDEAFILTRIESAARISEVLQLSPLGLEMTQKTICGFLSVGIVEFVKPTAARPATQPAAASHAYRSASAPVYQPSASDHEPSEEAPEEVKSDIFLMRDRTKTLNYYELLNVPATAPLDEIKKSYYALAKKYHPDRYHQSTASEVKDALDTIFSTLSQAYDTLKVPATRTSYDAKVFRLESPSPASDKPAPSESFGTAAPQQKLAELNYKQGRGYFEQEDYWTAIQAFRQSVRLEPANSRYRYWLAMSLSKNAKWRREAEEHFLKAIELEQFAAEYYVGLGMLYKEAGMEKRAENQFKQALQVSPDNRTAREALGALLAVSDKRGRGLGAFKDFFKRK